MNRTFIIWTQTDSCGLMKICSCKHTYWLATKKKDIESMQGQREKERIRVKGKGGGGWKIGEITCQTHILKPRPYCQGIQQSLKYSHWSLSSMLNFYTNKIWIDGKIMVPFWQSLAVDVACWSKNDVVLFFLFVFCFYKTTDYKCKHFKSASFKLLGKIP